MTESSSESKQIEAFRSFKLVRLLNEDTGTKFMSLLGKIGSQDAIIVAEKTAFNTSPEILAKFQEPSNLSALTMLGQNDIYHWFLASHSEPDNEKRPEIKFTFIYPATETHIKKYSRQSLRMVTETPQLYRELVKPYMESTRVGGRLNWVYNILAHQSEAEKIVFEDTDEHEGFILLPDLKWDRKTLTSLYMMALVHRKDIMSLRDLTKKDVPWLRRVGHKIASAVCEAYPEFESNQIKLYVHYQPSYYHFHIHAVAISHDGGLGQTAGKAFLLGNVISQLESMPNEESSFADIELTYVLGEDSELWQTVFKNL
ncbi:mRNA decapping hydrolase [Terfezia boudieri ATCC MYA-4762]|uniref:mRNA decapping hydrolase n=1 Tax=Terfezia boudieri ATCC MYA-4762 TaxID=1051890 RepID=A0A3N4LVP2_9PEZI|nr:mRNA decapping hydrolase [Terfezia boudieri ATCC MYA-4762]